FPKGTPKRQWRVSSRPPMPAGARTTSQRSSFRSLAERKRRVNRYYTVMVIPEKTSKVRRLLVPGWIVRGSLVALFFLFILAMVMALDYGFVMNQISENRELKLENRRLRQEVQIFNNKIQAI